MSAEILRREPWGAIVATAGAIVLAALLIGVTSVEALGAAMLLGALVPLMAVPGRAAILAVGAGIGAWVIAVGAVEAVPDIVNPQPSVDRVVGAAAYYGTPYLGRQIAAIAAIAVILGAAIAAKLLADRRLTAVARDADGDTAVPRRASGRGALAALVAATAVIALTLVPDLQTRTLENALHPVSTSWDAVNVATWDAFIDRGLVPMKDFFYPYGYQWVFRTFPEGPVWFWLAQVTMLALAAWSLWRLTGGRTLRVVLCVLALAALGPWIPYVLWRYLPALVVAISYAALGPARHSRPNGAHAVFGAACLLAAFIEFDLLVFGLVGAALVLVGDLLSGELEWRPRDLLRGLALDALPVLGSVAVLLLAWVATDTADASLDWFVPSGELAALGGQFNNSFLSATSGLSLRPSLASARVALPALLLAGGLAQSMLAGRPGRPAAAVLLAGAGPALMLELKHLLRFVGDGQLVIPMVVLLWAAILLWSPRKPAVAAVVGAFVIAAGFAIQRQSDAVTTYLGDVVTSPRSAARSALLPTKGDEVDRVIAERFDLGRFGRFPDGAAAREYRSVVGPPPVPEFAVLGDGQLLYAIFDQDPPFHVNLYDAARIGEQRRMLEGLREQDPPYLVVPGGRQPVDGFPYHVRNPLLYAYAIENYVPVSRDPAADVLRKRRPNESIAAAYWRSTLGGNVDLGYVPSLSDAASAEPCSSGPGCARYAFLEGDASATGQPIELRVSGGGRTYTVTMRTEKGLSTYPVRLDRLWFWPLVRADARIESGTPGWEARTEGVRAGDALY